MRILLACECSNVTSSEFRKRGHYVLSCDLQPNDEDQTNHYMGDIFDVLYDGWDMMIGHPPCTYLSNAGIGWFNEDKYGDKARERKRNRLDAFEFFMKLYNAPIPKIALENPVGYVNSAFRKPDQVLQPYYFGDNHKKGTCLWLRGLPKIIHAKEDDLFMVRTHIDEPEPLSIQYRNPSKYYKGGEEKKRYFTDAYTRDAKVRSKTFVGIARAMAEQWG